MPKRLATVIISWPSAWTAWGGKRLGVLVRQRSVDEVPLGLECAAEDGVSGFLGRRFQHIQGGLSLQSSDIGGREVEGSKFGHVVRGGIINTADQDTNMTHGALLNQCRSSMLPQLGLVSAQNLTQPLFALPQNVNGDRFLSHLIKQLS